MSIAVVGLGQMGRPMALRLLDAGHQVCGYNRSRTASEVLVARGVRVVDDPRALPRVDALITMLADDQAVEAVWLASGLLASLAPRTVHVNMATVSVGLAKRLHQMHEKHETRYVAAPVFGRPAAAEKGELDVIAAGAKDDVDWLAPLFAPLARQVFVVGEDPALANAVKIARNFLLAAVIESLGEAFALTGRLGVAPARFLEIITSTSLGAPAYKNYGKLMVERSFEPAQFKMSLGAKDVALALRTAEEAGVAMPTAQLIAAHMAQAIARGAGEQDWTALAQFIADR